MDELGLLGRSVLGGLGLRKDKMSMFPSCAQTNPVPRFKVGISGHCLWCGLLSMGWQLLALRMPILGDASPPLLPAHANLAHSCPAGIWGLYK